MEKNIIFNDDYSFFREIIFSNGDVSYEARPASRKFGIEIGFSMREGGIYDTYIDIGSLPSAYSLEEAARLIGDLNAAIFTKARVDAWLRKNGRWYKEK